MPATGSGQPQVHPGVYVLDFSVHRAQQFGAATLGGMQRVLAKSNPKPSQTLPDTEISL
jgi:hypothetical protein